MSIYDEARVLMLELLELNKDKLDSETFENIYFFVTNSNCDSEVMEHLSELLEALEYESKRRNDSKISIIKQEIRVLSITKIDKAD